MWGFQSLFTHFSIDSSQQATINSFLIQAVVGFLFFIVKFRDTSGQADNVRRVLKQKIIFQDVLV